ncbi:hypothetical protein [Streptomyces sp. NPDC059455]|uniref:hypothetical protein n=1 Tax=Streptomyces sp. NPDC059455 TaxID=3346837 RepID=UPI0036AC927B
MRAAQDHEGQSFGVVAFGGGPAGPQVGEFVLVERDAAPFGRGVGGEGRDDHDGGARSQAAAEGPHGAVAVLQEGIYEPEGDHVVAVGVQRCPVVELDVQARSFGLFFLDRSWW